jgi:predicted pyridoxine 5'-phosphate oxidase superfamily flavin-nucleotide-binding protein
MKTEKLEKAVSLSQRRGFICIATADSKGIPHIATAGKMELTDEACLAIRELFCPGTMANLQTNKFVSIVVWDRDSDSGYQILGTLEGIEDTGILNGYAPDLESEPPLPQVERQLLIKVQKITGFKLGPHSDAED